MGYVQGNFGISVSAPTGTFVLGAVTAGHTILVLVIRPDTSTAQTVTDTLGNTYSLVKSFTGSALCCDFWHCINVLGGGVSITCTQNTGGSGISACAEDYSGIVGLDSV